MKTICALLVVGAFALVNAEDVNIADYIDMAVIQKFAKFNDTCYASCLYNNKPERPASSPTTTQERIAYFKEKVCPKKQVFETCFNGCPARTEDDRFFKPRMDKFVTYLGELCNPAIVDHIGCLVDVAKTPSPTCDEQCREVGEAVLGRGIGLLLTNAVIDEGVRQKAFNFTKESLTNLIKEIRQQQLGMLRDACKFANCRFKCRKNDIKTKCNEQGVEAVVSLAGSASRLLDYYYEEARTILTEQGRQLLGSKPEECNQDKLVQGT